MVERGLATNSEIANSQRINTRSGSFFKPNRANRMVDYPTERAVVGNSNGFEKLFGEPIMSSIRDLLGESSMRAILYHLNLENVGGDPQMFDTKLRELLHAP